MRKCLVTETETLLKLSGVKKISSVYFGGGKVFITSLQNPLVHVTLQFYKVIYIFIGSNYSINQLLHKKYIFETFKQDT